MIRTIILWLLFLKYRATHRELHYKGFSVICSLSGGKIAIGGILRCSPVSPATCWVSISDVSLWHVMEARLRLGSIVV